MKINMKRRQAVMGRSIKLGHCVCNPKKPCPCDTFKEYNVCSCAGERLPRKSGAVPLTRYVRKAGCASKVGQADLKRILGALPPITDPRVIVGCAAGDDAGVYELDKDHYLVQTVDVFTPNVDDAFLFGKIAAANSVSDVYAMGGRPLTALSVIGFPIDDLDGEIMKEILRGGMETLEEAGCRLIGGHSVNDEEIKCGFAVTGVIDGDKVTLRDAPRPGDALVLTKPLGTGMIAFAAQIGRISPGYLNEVGEMMATLNKDAAELMSERGAHACTDVTGFGLMGHLSEMIRGGGVGAEISLEALPVFAGVAGCLEREILPGAVERNMEFGMAWAVVENEDAAPFLPIIYDPQTSGGLLIALPEENAERFIEEMKKRGHSWTSLIGRITEKEPYREEGRALIKGKALKNYYGNPEEVSFMSPNERIPEERGDEAEMPGPAEEDEPCCANPPSFDDEAPAASPERGPVLASPKIFGDFMKEANKPGLMGAKQKKLTAIALSIARHCEPCLKIHIQGALKMGITRAEIDEAAWLAISFCGCPAMMFYKDALKELGLS